MDDKTYFEIMPDWAKNITVGFARMEGHPVGIVANNPLFLAGCLDIDTSTKVSRLFTPRLLDRCCVNHRKTVSYDIVWLVFFRHRFYLLAQFAGGGVNLM